MDTYENIPEDAIETVESLEAKDEGSWIRKGKRLFKKVVEKGSHVLSWNRSSKRVLFEHSSKGQLLIVSDKGLTKQGKLVGELQETYLVRIADISKFHSMDLKISTKLCNIEEVHIFITYI